MDIDANPKMKESMRHEKQGEMERSWALRDEFTAEVRVAEGRGQDLCSCKADCIYHGRCLECVAIHRGHQDHLPNCLKPIVK